MKLYELMDWLDFYQTKIELVGNVFIGIMCIAALILWMVPSDRLMDGWCKVAKTMLGYEIRKNG